MKLDQTEMSTVEAALALRVTTQTIRNNCRSGVLRGRMVLGRWRIERAQVEAMMQPKKEATK